MSKFDLSAKGAHIGVPSIYQKQVFSETIRQVELKIHMKTDKLARIYTNYSGHIHDQYGCHAHIW